MSIFNQVTDTVGAVRIFREAQAPDKYVTICDNFAKPFNILQLQSQLSDSCKMWEGRANVSKIALSLSDQHHINCLKGKSMPSPSPLVLIGRFYSINRPCLLDFWKRFRTHSC